MCIVLDSVPDGIGGVPSGSLQIMAYVMHGGIDVSCGIMSIQARSPEKRPSFQHHPHDNEHQNQQQASQGIIVHVLLLMMIP
jgi:adenylyl- and sulfurtransferase ThiI